MIQSKLKKMKLGEGESVLYEEENISILGKTRPRATNYVRSIISITNFRIILAQKMLFGGYQIRHVINLRDEGSGFSIKGGYVTCSSSKELIGFEDGKKPAMTIETSGGEWVGVLHVYVKDPRAVIEIIKDNI